VAGPSNTKKFGAIYRVTKRGAFSIVYEFDGTTGYAPEGPLVLDGTGGFYGVATSGGTEFNGTIYHLSSAGQLSTLFDQNVDVYGVNALLLARDGNLYGTSSLGGANRFDGTVFRLTPSGELTILHSFQRPDGFSPSAGLVEGQDGNFYGSTGAGGASGNGSIFRITPTGELTYLYSFGAQPDGSRPVVDLAQGRDGSLYGTTVFGGEFAAGSAFRITPTGTYTNLGSFQPDDAGESVGPSVLARVGSNSFLGATRSGGSGSLGSLVVVY
jgi:uncharacterized repeat protein (TIGR03803 family)